MASPSTLERRMLAIVDEQRDRRPLSLRTIAGGVAAVALTLGLATVVQVQGQPEATATVSRVVKGEAPPAASVADSESPLVEITAKFIEISDRNSDLPDFLGEADPKARPGIRALLTDQQMQDGVRALTSRKGVDLLSAPRVITRSGQSANIEIIREFRYPTEFEQDAKTREWAPKVFDTKNVGVTFAVTAVVSAEGTIDLQMRPEVTEFEGYLDFDAAPAKGGAKLDASALPTDRALGGPDAKTFPKGHRKQPTFSTRKMDASATVNNGATIVLGSLNREDVQTVEDSVPVLGGLPLVGRLFRSTTQVHFHRRLFIFVTARIVTSAVVAEEKPAP